ncbi:hypothetical protein FZC84_05395 [Rossellomorea vietnamensis]|uniref:Uncharacterized protein n=1 Tax=Rossellomorea vietnamensis TaxID=218284 RepID=A0A5D4MIW5_9BACI|nr:hypothetical protein [Rossellomorea vietnamensis]TYS00926.1 hypothetical protein FZC84_05395 [Rossellomorea vietnamensis]
MEEYIFALIAFVLLLPVLFFMPGAMTRKGKVWIAGGGLLISLLGLLASNQYPLGLVAIILFILVIVSSVMFGNRFGPLLLAEEGLADRNNSAEAVAGTERPEKVLFTSVAEEQEPPESILEEPEAVQEEALEESENDTRTEFINEDLEEIPLLTENGSSMYDIKEEAVLPEIEENVGQDSEDKEDSILEEDTLEQTVDEDLSEIEMLIQQEEGDHSEPVHNTDEVETLMADIDESLEESAHIGMNEDWESDERAEEHQELSEIELLIDGSDDTESAKDDSELYSDLEDDITADTEADQPEANRDHALGELTEIEAEFLMAPAADESDLEVLSLIEESMDEGEESKEIESSDEPEEPVLEEGILEAGEDDIQTVESEILHSGDSIEQGEEQEEELEPAALLEADEMEDSSEESYHGEEDQSSEEETQQGQEPEGNAQLQTLIIHTIAEELAYYRNKMALEEFEALAGQYLHPELHDRDYYVISQQLIQRYYESQEYEKMMAFIKGMEERFLSYPVLKSELNDYKEIAWKNTLKQMM